MPVAIQNAKNRGCTLKFGGNVKYIKEIVLPIVGDRDFFLYSVFSTSK